MGELGLRHLEREEGDGLLLLDGDEVRDVRHYRRLAHGRPRGEDDQVARLEAAGDLVEIREPGGRAGQVPLSLGELLEAGRLALEDVRDRAKS